MRNVDTVKDIYAAFGRGDISAIIDKLDDNVEWDVDVATPGVPWLQPRRGKANIPAFSESLAPLTFTDLRAAHLLRGREPGDGPGPAGDRPCAERQTLQRSIMRATCGRSAPSGKVVKYQHITDTALHQRVAKGE